MIEFGHATHIGLHRKRNEDTYHADPSLGLFLVADGLGGHRHGALAAALARDGVVADVREGRPLDQAMQRADAGIMAHAAQTAHGLPMGTTLAALHLRNDGFQAAWVGDSRIYLWDGSLHRLSHDHSRVQELVDLGLIDDQEARGDPRRNLVTQALGITPPEDLHVGTARGRLQAGMRFLLCSDGLTEELDDDAIARGIARDDLAAQECVDQLILDALAAGGRDNVTAILVRVGNSRT